MYNLIEEICGYIEFLKKDYGLSITIHDKNSVLMRNKELLQYNIHGGGYCLYLKSKKEIWDECIHRQVKIYNRLEKERAPFYGACYMGVEEFVFPVFGEEKIVGFISVSGYRGRCDFKCAAARFGLDSEEVRALYNKFLSADVPPFDKVKTLIAPLSAMLSLYILTDADAAGTGTGEYIYAHALTYIKRNYGSKIYIEDISRACHCSPSYLMRIFKKISGTTIISYIESLRIKRAERYLENTDMSISRIAFSCGFEDSNYFSNTFKKTHGKTPSEYRREKR